LKIDDDNDNHISLSNINPIFETVNKLDDIENKPNIPNKEEITQIYSALKDKATG